MMIMINIMMEDLLWECGHINWFDLPKGRQLLQSLPEDDDDDDNVVVVDEDGLL